MGILSSILQILQTHLHQQDWTNHALNFAFCAIYICLLMPCLFICCLLLTVVLDQMIEMEIELLKYSIRFRWSISNQNRIKPLAIEISLSLSVWSIMPWPYHSSTTHPPLDLIQWRVIFKTAVLLWKCIHGVASAYLQELCTPVESVQDVLDCNLHRLDVSSCQDCGRQSPSIDSLYGTVCCLLCATAAYHWTSLGGIWRVIFSNSHEHHPAPLWHLAVLA